MGLTSSTESVERFIPAPPEKIFALLSDPSRHPEIDGSGTVREAAGEPRHVGLGDTFGMAMHAGISYTMVNTVVEYEQDRRIAWQPRPDIKVAALVIGGRIWRYELEPRDGGTLVRETWDISQERVPPLVWAMRGEARKGMTKTLERIEQVVTGG